MVSAFPCTTGLMAFCVGVANRLDTASRDDAPPSFARIHRVPLFDLLGKSVPGLQREARVCPSSTCSGVIRFVISSRLRAACLSPLPRSKVI